MTETIATVDAAIAYLLSAQHATTEVHIQSSCVRLRLQQTVAADAHAAPTFELVLVEGYHRMTLEQLDNLHTDPGWQNIRIVLVLLRQLHRDKYATRFATFCLKQLRHVQTWKLDGVAHVLPPPNLQPQCIQIANQLLAQEWLPWVLCTTKCIDVRLHNLNFTPQLCQRLAVVATSWACSRLFLQSYSSADSDHDLRLKACMTMSAAEQLESLTLTPSMMSQLNSYPALQQAKQCRLWFPKLLHLRLDATAKWQPDHVQEWKLVFGSSPSLVSYASPVYAGELTHAIPRKPLTNTLVHLNLGCLHPEGPAAFGATIELLPHMTQLRCFVCILPLMDCFQKWHEGIRMCHLREWLVAFNVDKHEPVKRVMTSIETWLYAWSRHVERSGASLTTFQFGWDGCYDLYNCIDRVQTLVERNLGRPSSSVRVIHQLPLALFETYKRQCDNHERPWHVPWSYLTHSTLGKGAKQDITTCCRVDRTVRDATHLAHWISIVISSAFVRSNRNHMFQDSILSLLPTILAFSASPALYDATKTWDKLALNDDVPLFYTTLFDLATKQARDLQAVASKWLSSRMFVSH